MNRKRFLKLLMARGIQRSDAQAWAANIRNTGSYSELYVVFIMENGYFVGDMVRLLKKFFKAYEETAQIQKSVKHFLETAVFKAARMNGRNICYEKIANFSEKKYQRAELVGRKNAYGSYR